MVTGPGVGSVPYVRSPGCVRADALDEQFLSVEVQAQQDGCSADISMPEVSVMLSLEPQGVHSLEGLPHAEEAYELCISAAGIAVRATQPHGLFNGAISLLQLLPPCAPLSGNIRLDCLQVRRLHACAACSNARCSQNQNAKSRVITCHASLCGARAVPRTLQPSVRMPVCKGTAHAC